MPGPSQLLTVAPGTAFLERLNNDSGDVISQGQLSVGEDLTLAARNLDLEGQVAAGGDVSLLAVDTVEMSDTAGTPFRGMATNLTKRYHISLYPLHRKGLGRTTFPSIKQSDYLITFLPQELEPFCSIQSLAVERLQR